MRGIEGYRMSKTDIYVLKADENGRGERMRLEEESGKIEDEVKRIDAQMSGSENVRASGRVAVQYIQTFRHCRFY